NLFWGNRMIFFINIIVMSSSFLMGYLMKDIAMIVNHKLCLYSMPFLISLVIHLSSIFISRPWNLLLCGIYKSKKSWKILFNFFRSSEPLCYHVYLLRNRQTFSYQTFNLLDIPTNVALI